jgi:S1-C subfamily serine protease
MENTRSPWTWRPGRLVLSITTVVALAAGATWHGFAASEAAPATQVAATTAQSPSMNRVIAGGRESYADIVKMVAPAVVTIRVESRARMVSTGADD